MAVSSLIELDQGPSWWYYVCTIAVNINQYTNLMGY